MTSAEQAQVESALKTAYQKGFHEARYYPHRREPALRVMWGEQPHVLSIWDTGTAGIEQVPASRLDGRAP